MRKTLPITFVLVGLAVGVVLCVSIILRRGGQTATCTIGVLFPLTGDEASYGQKGRRAIEMAVDDVNFQRGGTGLRVAAIFEDSRGNAKDGVSAAEKLITINRVPAIVGDALSAVTLPVAAKAEANQVVLMAPCSSAPALTYAGEYVYRIWPSDLIEGKAAADFAVAQGFRRGAVFHVNNDYGNGIADVFVRHFFGDGRNVILRSAYQATTTDWRPIVTPLVSAGADVVYIAGYYKDTAAILRTATELGVKAQFMGATAIEDENLIKLAGSAAEGIIYPLATGFDADSPDPVTKAFVTSFRKRFGYEPGWMEAHAYDSFMLVCGGVGSAEDDVSGPAIKAYLDHLGVYHGVTGEFRFDENGDVIREVVLKTVKDGRFVRLRR